VTLPPGAAIGLVLMAPSRQLNAATLIVVAGPPGSGKTCLASRLGSDLRWPVLSKDTIKESLLDSFGGEDLQTSRDLGQASFKLLIDLAESLYKNGAAFILESAFRRGDGSLLMDKFPGAQIVQVYCQAEDNICLQRFRDRNNEGRRHAGHADAERESELRSYLGDGLFGVLDIPGHCIEIDTNDFSSQEYECTYKKILDSAA
jgi:predicted kinase